MYKERENHLVPAIIALIAVISFTILTYILLVGVNWLTNRIFGLSVGPNI